MEKKVTELSVVRFYEKGVIKIHFFASLGLKDSEGSSTVHRSFHEERQHGHFLMRNDRQKLKGMLGNSFSHKVGLHIRSVLFTLLYLYVHIVSFYIF